MNIGKMANQNDKFRELLLTKWGLKRIKLSPKLRCFKETEITKVLLNIQMYDHWVDNPYRDMGGLEFGTFTVRWCISYLDIDHDIYSYDPSYKIMTRRVLSLMLQEEYEAAIAT